MHYETIGVIQGMQHLPATFTPGPRIGDGLDETIARMQGVCDEQRLAEPVTVRKGAANISPGISRPPAAPRRTAS